ncbi:MAG TPA: DUF3794 domain-containing protein [Bacillota bacterium]|jgi:hypothetical protein|nr:DUF3794 domain-containing protein [Bacillota bacterium]HOL10581.1 DUF3794 domain-containing protein [Bacillota bacterium]HPO98283.1 DUF3794 domain-containing protein [Bacillota bacterium]
MENDDFRDESLGLNGEKPKKSKKKKAVLEDGTDKIDVNSQTQTKKVKSKKKSTSKRNKNKKSTVVEVAQSDLEKTGSLQPTGQGIVHDLQVRVVEKKNLNRAANEQLDLIPEVKNLQGGKVQLGPVLSQKKVVETAQSTILPFAAVKVRNIDVKIKNLTTEIIPNKVIVQGIIHEQLYFVGTDDIVHHLADDIHFSTFLDMPGAMPGMNATVNVVVEDVITELAPDGLSITKKVVLEVFVKVTETVQVSFLPGSGPPLLLKEVIGEDSTQTLIETDFTLPEPAIKVDEIVGRIDDLEVEIIPDKVIIQGVLHKQIFFVGNDNIGKHQAEDVHFSTFVDIPGAAPGMDVHVSPRIEAIIFHLVSPTLLRQKAVLEFFVKVTDTVRQNVTVGAGPLFKVEEFIGEGVVQELSETVVTLDLPAIKVREIVAQIRDLETFIITDKVIVQGIIHKQIFYIGTDNIEHHQAEDIPFAVFIDIPGAVATDQVQINPVIEAVFFELIAPTQLRQKVIVAINAVVARELQINLVLDIGPLYKVEQVIAENTKQEMVVRREMIPPPPPVLPITISEEILVFPEVVRGEQQIIVRNEVDLPVTAVKIKEIQAMITDLKANVIADAVVVEGTVEKTVFFVDTDNLVRSLTEEVPFSILVNIPGITPEQAVSVAVEIENISFALDDDGNTVIQNIVLKAIVTGQEGTEVSVVTDVTGPGIVQTKVRVRAFVLTPDGPVLQELDVVTDVSGPGIAGVERQTLLLDVVDDGNPNPVPVDVVVRVILE